MATPPPTPRLISITAGLPHPLPDRTRQIWLMVDTGRKDGRLLEVPLDLLELADLVDQAGSVLRGELRRRGAS